MSFWDIVWFIFITWVFVAYLMVMFRIIADIFRDRDTSSRSRPSGPLATPAATRSIGPETAVGASRRETRATAPTQPAAAAAAHALMTESPRSGAG